MESIVQDQEESIINAEPKSEWNSDFLERHHLQGHIYKRTQNKTYYPYWKSQLTRNSFAKIELEKIGQDLLKENIKVYLLKGFSLMGEIYKDWGERYVSDVDLLISYDELWKLTDFLKMYGYEKRKGQKWLENRHRHSYVKKTDELNLTIEVHTQLFWHTSLITTEDLEQSQLKGFYRLSRENQLIHLCGHLAFQNAYSKLFWLMDIFKYVDAYKSKIDWKVFWKNAEAAGLYKACYFSLFLCQKLGLNLQPIFFCVKKKKRFSLYLLKKIVNYSYLYNPEKHRVRMLLVKIFIKDSYLDSLRYFYAWLKTFKKS